MTRQAEPADAPPVPTPPQAVSTALLLEAFLAFFTASMALWLLRLSRTSRPQS